MAFNHIRDAHGKQARRDFTVDLIWWGLLRLAPINDYFNYNNDYFNYDNINLWYN